MKPVRSVNSETGRVTPLKKFATSCGKLGYSSRKVALANAIQQSKETGERIEAYKCRRGCHCFHLGHPPGSREVVA